MQDLLDKSLSPDRPRRFVCNPRWSRVGILLLSVWGAGLRSEEPVWPTDAGRLLSATFCEYRSAHFHAGIDIKTWGQDGYRVFAIDSGSVVRIQVSPHGYGRAVYFETAGNLTAVYAHLSRFNESIEKIVREEQERQGRFRVNIYLRPGDRVYRRGEVLAYTGRTGTVAPHLHFEIRDAFNRPVNPYLVHYRVADRIPPRIHALALSPLSYPAHAGGDFQPRVYPVRMLGPGRYRIDEVITGWGELGFAVSATDLADGAENPLAVYSLEVYIDTVRVFSSRYDRFSYEVTRQMVIHRDGRLLADHGREFQRLYRAGGNTLDFYEPALPRLGVLAGGAEETFQDGRTALGPGDHPFRVVAGDFQGNRSELTGILRIAPAILNHDRPLNFSYSRPAPFDEPDVLSGTIQSVFYDDYIRFRVGLPAHQGPEPGLYVSGGMNRHVRVPLTRVAEDAFAAAYPVSFFSGDRLRAEAVCPSEGVIARSPDFPVFSAVPGRGEEWVSDDRRFRVRFRTGSLFAPLHGTVIPDTASLPADSRVYAVIPEETPLDDPVLVQFAGLDVTDSRLGVYRISGTGTPAYAGRETEDGFLGARTRHLGRFAALRDTVPPEILYLRPAEGTVYRTQTPRIAAGFRDALSGIGGEDDYVFRLNGRRLIMEYDPPRNTAFYPYPADFEPGDYVLSVEIRDRAGNVSRRETRFRILPN